IFSETEKHIPFQVSDNQIDGNQRGIADDVSKIVIGKETRCIHVAADKLGYLIPQLRTLPLTLSLGQHHRYSRTRRSSATMLSNSRSLPILSGPSENGGSHEQPCLPRAPD